MKIDGTLGMSIVGGINKVCHPFGINEPGIFISKVCRIVNILCCCFDPSQFMFFLMPVAVSWKKRMIAATSTMTTTTVQTAY